MDPGELSTRFIASSGTSGTSPQANYFLNTSQAGLLFLLVYIF